MSRTRSGGLVRAAALCLALAAPACTGGGTPPAAPSTPGTAEGTAPRAPRQLLKPLSPKSLCDHPSPSPQPSPSRAESLPPVIAQVADEVEAERGLRFQRPVSPEPVSHQRLVELLQAGLDQEYPADMEQRKGRAWATIGAIPPGTDLRQAILDFAGSQIIGFYDTTSHRLVFVGSASPTPFQRMTLAHELTHALQDQAFGLDRLDRLMNACRDDEFLGMLGLTEGDAVESQVRWAESNLNASQVQELDREAGAFPPPPASVPPFVRSLLQFPYTDGRAFVVALRDRGGEGAVNAAFRNPPDSTEQILHPDRYPADQPRAVSVPDIREKLGGPWNDLDVQDVGEEWLRLLLETRLSSADAGRGAAGWDGGQYRAWSLGDRTAVLMQTVWDTTADARDIALLFGQFLQGRFGAVNRIGSEVDVLFGSDRVALEDLERATG